ncbi:hypothetical protein M5204_002964 [Vibrio vulnificus]|nr:hypothetical protein [Vibrio vulnificus]
MELSTVSPESCYTTDANSAQIRFHYRATPAIAVILANAGIHLPARYPRAPSSALG